MRIIVSRQESGEGHTAPVDDLLQIPDNQEGKIESRERQEYNKVIHNEE